MNWAAPFERGWALKKLLQSWLPVIPQVVHPTPTHHLNPRRKMSADRVPHVWLPIVEKLGSSLDQGREFGRDGFHVIFYGPVIVDD